METASAAGTVQVPALAEVFVLPCSFAQRRLWLVDRMDSGSPAYTVAGGLRLRGTLDVDALRAALGEVVARHESLRTTFAVMEGEPVQVIRPAAELALPVLELGAEAGDAREAELARTLRAEAERPFDLREGPLFRPALVRVGADDHVLLVCFHHIVGDGWSTGVLLREVSALYAAAVAGEPSPLPALRIQYADFAVWQRDHLAGDALGEQVAYWGSRLRGAPAVLELPTDRPRPARQTFRGAYERVEVPRAVADALRALALREGATPFMVLMAAWQVLLSRWSGQDDVVVGTSIAGRTRPELEPLIGFFANTLPLRGDLSGNPTFLALLARVREATLGAYAHQDLPFEKLVDELQPARSLSYNAVFQAFLALDNASGPGLALPGIDVSPVPVLTGTAKFDLSLLMRERGDALEGWMEYATDLFDAPTIRRMVAHLGVLLDAVATHPERRIADLPLLSAGERAQVVIGFNPTSVDAAAVDSCLHTRFERQAAAGPDRTAVIHGDERVSYDALNRRANQLAHHLRARGVGPESRVGICLERGPDLLIALLAVLKADGAYVPIDPAYPADRIAYVAGDSGIALLLTTSDLHETLAEVSAERISLDTGWDVIARESEENPTSTGDPDNLAYVIYTSGSTGRPKGAMLSHTAVVRLFSATDEWFRFGPEDVWTLFHSSAFDFSVWEIWGPLLHGGALVVVPYLTSRSPVEFRHLLARHRVTVLNQTPSAFQQLVQVDQQAADALSTLRLVVFAGEALQVETLRPWLDRYGPAHPRLVNMYGITETCVHVTYHPVTGADLRHEMTGSPIGVAIPDLRLYVLDAAMNPAPIGVPGEMFVGGAGLARGYHGRPGLTAERFVPDPFGGPGERLYRSGDRVRWRADGRLEYHGRIDLQVKIRGFRIEPGEIEAVLLESPRVRECVVAVLGDGGDKRLVAYVVAQDGIAPSTRELREIAARRLPDHMVPAAFVLLDKLPLTGNGKVDRRALPEPDAVESDASGAEQIAPRTPVEEVLAGIWGEVLKAERIGIHDDFFALGGHSLRATQVVSRVHEVLRVDLPLRALFESPTIAGLADTVEAHRRGGGAAEIPPIAPATGNAVGNVGPLSFAQQRLWFLDRMQPGGHAYNVPSALRLRGPLDVPALERALGEIVRRHAALRTTLADHGDGPVQVVHAADDAFRLPVSEPAPGELAMRMEDEAWRPFDLTAGPLFRAHLFRAGPDEHVLVTTVHHAVFDGWSGGVLGHELSALYAAFARGEPSPLAELAVQYADYAAWQRDWLRGPVLDAQVAYWRGKLASAPALELPTDRPRPPVQAHRGAMHRFTLPPALADAARALARREGATPFMLLLAAFQALLGRCTGQHDVVVGTPIANRTRREVEPLIGYFANTLALRTDLSGDPGFRELLARVRDTTLDAYAHQDVPFEKLVEELRVERDLSRGPLVQALFILQTTGSDVPTLPGIAAQALPLTGDTARMDLVVALRETPDGLAGVVEYDRDLFEGSTIARMMGHFGVLLHAAVADPGCALSALPLLPDAERQRVVSEWNDTEAAYPTGVCIHHLVEAQAARTPELVAVIHPHGRLTYAELDARATRLASYLRSRGVGPESRVGVCLERGAEMVVALLGVLKAGGAYVPLEPSYPAERLAWQVGDAGLSLVLTVRDLTHHLPADGPPTVALDAEANAIAAARDTGTGRMAEPGNAAYVIYTSGSTGRPKGVVNEHRGVCNRLLWMQDRFAAGPGDRVLLKTPFGFDVSVWELFWPLMTGATQVIARPEGHREPAYLAELIRTEGITIAHFVPSMLQAFLDEPGVEHCASLRHVVCSGEALPAALRDRFTARMGAALHNLYGPTEAAVDVTAWTCGEDDPDGGVPIGRPIANTQAYVLEPGGQPTPEGVAGELHLGGVQVARGYLGRPALTAERFVPDPFGAPGARLYRTGDRARWRAGGVLEFLGRLDFQVKIRGFRVEPGEVEAALAAHPGIREAVVIAREDSPGDARLVAYVVAHDPAPDAAELRAFLKDRLPEAMVPSAFVMLDRLPLTTNGKLDRRALPAPDRDARPADALVPPATALEEAIAAAWRQVLERDAVGVEDNFFDLGGHSLLLPRLARLLRETIAGLGIVDLFRYPTIRSLARFAEAGDDGAVVDEGRQSGERRRTLKERQQAQAQRRRAPATQGEAL